MAHNGISAPVRNYTESEDLIFEIGDEETTPRKKRSSDDHVGYGIETEPDELGDIEDGGDSFEEFSDEFEWENEGDNIE